MKSVPTTGSINTCESSSSSNEEDKYGCGVFKSNIPSVYEFDYIMIKSRHIGCLPLTGNHSEDLEYVSKEEFSLLYTYDNTISKKIKHFGKDIIHLEVRQFHEYIHERIINSTGMENTVYALISVDNTINDHGCCTGCCTISQFVSLIEKAWGEKSENNLTYLSADRVQDTYILKIREKHQIQNKILVLEFGNKIYDEE